MLVGRSTERVLRFGNHSGVAANFTVVSDGDDQADGVFSIVPSKWVAA